MPVCIEDECNPDLPPASLLFRSARQYAYGVLFSLAETQRRAERLAMRKRAPVEGEGGRGAQCQGRVKEIISISQMYRRLSQIVMKNQVQVYSFNGAHQRRTELDFTECVPPTSLSLTLS